MDYENYKRWKVIVTEDLQNDLDSSVYYLLVEKMSEQAARAVLDDYDEKARLLSVVSYSW